MMHLIKLWKSYIIVKYMIIIRLGYNNIVAKVHIIKHKHCVFDKEK